MSRRAAHIAVFLLAAAAAAALSCNKPIDEACTEIGCSGEIRVVVNAVPEGATVSLTLANGDFLACVMPATGAGACQGDLVEAMGGALAAEGGTATLVMSTGMTDGAPSDTFSLVVTQGEAYLLEERDLSFTWSGPDFPNGESCDAPFGCWSTEVERTVTP